MTEKKYKAKFYRCVPPGLRDEIKRVARALCVSTDDIALAFFQAAIQAVRTEALTLEPQPVAGRMTLFPEDEKPGWRYSQRPLLPAEVSPIINPALIERKRWKFAASYRIPDEVHDEIKEIAAENLVGIGVVASYFLEWGLQEYQAQKLALAPRSLTINQTLFLQPSSL